MVTQQTLPLKFEPPFRDRILDATGRTPDTWVSWFTRTSDRLADHETRLTTAEANIVTLISQVTTLNSQLATVESQVATLNSEVASILARLTAAGIP